MTGDSPSIHSNAHGTKHERHASFSNDLTSLMPAYDVGIYVSPISISAGCNERTRLQWCPTMALQHFHARRFLRFLNSRHHTDAQFQRPPFADIFADNIPSRSKTTSEKPSSFAGRASSQGGTYIMGTLRADSGSLASDSSGDGNDGGGGRSLLDLPDAMLSEIFGEPHGDHARSAISKHPLVVFLRRWDLRKGRKELYLPGFRDG